jgi:ATP-dependent helicase HepA
VNLQFADLLIHLDLPWQVPRLEQRIGRCDRFVENGLLPITSKVVLVGDQPYAAAWCEFAASACGVFDQSVSSLQYVLADIEESVLTRVLQEGPSGFYAEIGSRAEELDVELAHIDAHASLDQATIFDKSAWNRLRRLDDSHEFRTHLKAWFDGVNVKTVTPSPGAIRLLQRNNARPQVPFDLEQQMRPYLSVGGKLKDLPLDRSTATRMGAPPLRAGHPLVNAIGLHLETTDRATAFAVLCHAKDHWPPTPFFRSDFLVRPGVNSGLRTAAEEAGVSDWIERLLVSSLPTTLITIHARADGRLEPNNAPPFSGKHQNLTYTSEDPGRFTRISEACGTWETMCDEASETARQHLDNHPQIASLRESATSNVRQALEDRMERETRRIQADLSVEGLSLMPLLDAVEELLDLEVRCLGGGVLFFGDETVAADPFPGTDELSP